MMEKLCEFCTELRPVVYCKSDTSHLYLSCDAKVHSANALSNRHLRKVLCDLCRYRPAYVWCTNQQMFMCHSSDRSLHDSSSQHQKHGTRSYMGCPSAKDFAALWGFELNEVNDNTRCDQLVSTSCGYGDSSVIDFDIPRQPFSQIGGPSVSSRVNCATPVSNAGSEVGSSSQQNSIQFTLGYMDLDYALRVEQPPAATDTDAQEVIENRQWWERSNRLSLMFIKSRMSKSIRGSIGDCATIKELMQVIEEQFVRSDKALASTLIKQFTTKAFDSSKGMRAYITEMRDIVSQLKGLKIEISEPFLVHFILDSLPSEYGPFKISYNTHKKNWSVTDLLTMCVQEEERMKHDRPESANMVVNDKVKTEKGQSGPQKKRKHNVLSKSNGSNGKKVTCFFCKKERHVKKSCIKYKEWLEKKGFSHKKETNNK